MFQDTNLELIVGSATSAAGETTLDTFETSGSVGEVIAVESDGTATASGSKKFMVVGINADGSLHISNVIPVANVTKASVKAYSAGASQLDYIGYNGSTGSMDEIANNLYQIYLEFRNYGAVSPENLYRKVASYKSTAVASTYSQEAVAEGLVESLIRNFSREPYERLRPAMITSDAGDALGTGTATSATIKFTKGSKTVTGWADVDDATTNAALAVGNYLRVGTAVTDPIYKIAAIDTTNDILTLDWAYQGDTALFNDTGLEQVTAADVAAGNCGVKLEGVAAQYEVGKDPYEVVRFKTQIDGFTATTVTESTAATLGNGEGKLIKDMEFDYRGNRGEIYRMGEPFIKSQDFEASSTGKYDVLTIKYFADTKLFQDVTVPAELVIACNAGTAGTDHTAMNKVIDLINNMTGNTQLSGLSSL